MCTCPSGYSYPVADILDVDLEGCKYFACENGIVESCQKYTSTESWSLRDAKCDRNFMIITYLFYFFNLNRKITSLQIVDGLSVSEAYVKVPFTKRIIMVE